MKLPGLEALEAPNPRLSARIRIKAATPFLIYLIHARATISLSTVCQKIIMVVEVAMARRLVASSTEAWIETGKQWICKGKLKGGEPSSHLVGATE